MEFDLFHLMIEVLEEEGYLDAFFDLEKENGFLRKLNKQIWKKIFSARLIRYYNAEQERVVENVEEKMSMEDRTKIDEV